MLAIDCASRITRSIGSLLKAKGVGGAIRYIAPKRMKSWKVMTKAELSELLEMGFLVGLVMEFRADDYKGGYQGGVKFGKYIVEALADLGVTARPVVYLTVDSDSSEFDLIEQFIRGGQDGVGEKAVIGIYGGNKVVTEMINRGVTTQEWQTLAWSHGRINNKVEIYQKDNDVSTFVEGFSLDLNDVYQAEGFLKSFAEATPIEEEEEDQMTAAQLKAFEELKQLVADQGAEITKLKEQVASVGELPSVPGWNKEAMEFLVQALGVNPNGTNDWNRIVALFVRAHEKGFFKS